MNIMVFLHGTAIMHAAAAGQPRAERVRQSRRGGPSVRDFASYLPAEAAVRKVAAWQCGGAQICYLSSHRAAQDVALDQDVLARHGFPAGQVYYRQPGESYADVVRRARAGLLIEDDCESIGGVAQTTRASLAAGPGPAVRCIVVPEFGGLAHLPDDPAQLWRPTLES